MSQKKKHEILGMNHSTASGRLIKDLLFDFVVKSGVKCFRCGEPLTRDDFSVEHKVAWQRAPDPVHAFFDLANITYSHGSCNAGAGYRRRSAHGMLRSYQNGCRCRPCKDANNERSRKARAKLSLKRDEAGAAPATVS